MESCQQQSQQSTQPHCTTGDEMKWTYGVVINTPQEQPVPLQLPPFTCCFGPVPRIKQPKTPLQVLQLLLTTVILEKIVQQTVAILE